MNSRRLMLVACGGMAEDNLFELDYRRVAPSLPEMRRTSLRSVIGSLTIENAFEGAKVPFRRSRSVIETGAADILLRLLYYGLRQLLQTLTGPHSIKLYLRCALDVIEPVVCVGNRLTYRGNAVVGHEQHRFVAEDLGKALAFLGIKGWAS